MAKKALYLIILVLILVMAGCTFDQRLARTYVKTERPNTFYILKPAYVYKYNLKEFEIDPADSLLPKDARDSILIEKSLFLKNVKDSLVIEQYTQGLAAGLEKYGAKVIPEKAVDSLMANGGNSYIVNIAQFSLEEYIHPYEMEEQVYDEIIVIDGIDLNAINYNFWIELGKMNSEEKNKVLFFSDFLLDHLSGIFKQNLMSGKLSFDYTIDTLTLSEMYSYTRDIGVRSAGYLFDYLMNTYVSENMPEDYPYERIYYHYDPRQKLLFPADDRNRVIELDEE